MPTTRTTKTGRRMTGYHHKSTTAYNTYKSNWSYSPTKFNPLKNEIKWRVGSYRNIHSQFTGTGKVTAFSPTTANRWMKYVAGGARVYKFKNNDFCKYFGKQWYDATPTTAFRWLKNKYGAGIKAVTRGKGNCWLVAATDRITARPFGNYYNWK